MFNVILDELPETVEINGREYPIITDFKSWLEFTRILSRRDVDEFDVIEALETVFDEIPNEEPAEMIRVLIGFLRAERPKDRKPDEPVLMRDIAEEQPAEPQIVDYDHDAAYIYAAFVQEYGINLITDKLHWFEFMALFSGLSKHCRITEIMGYRAVSDSEYSKMSKSEKAHIRKMKKVHALPDNRTAEEIENEFANSL